MFTQIASKFNGKATQKLYELDTPVMGYDMIIVSVKEDGVDGLSASYFVYGTKDGVTWDKEIDFGFGKDSYSHDDIVNKLVAKDD